MENTAVIKGEKVMVEKVMVMVERELVPNANQAGRIQEIEAKYIWLQ